MAEVVKHDSCRSKVRADSTAAADSAPCRLGATTRSVVTLLNLIDGELVPSASDRWLDVVEPATGQPYARLPSSSAADVDRAVAAAQRAFPAWSARPASERAACLRRIAQLLGERLEALAADESTDSGKPLRVATATDIPRAIQNFEFFADAATQFSSESHHDAGILNYTTRAPLGVVGCISPWNLPLYLFTWKIAPALAAGNCVVAKPSEVTPLTAYRLSEIAREAGLPPGVLNVVHGLGAEVGSALTAHPDVKAISFTGSTAVGSEIARVAAPAFKKLSLEMGGKNPNVIFADCNFEDAVETTVRSSFANQGQICLCGSRIFVERAIYTRFRDALVERVQRLVQGDPREPATEQGALVSETHLQKVLSYLALARDEGATALTGGGRVQLEGRCEAGYFVAPTLLEGLPPSSRINQEEIFGPVATIMPFDHEDEVLGWANSTSYGLAATVWTRDLDRAHRFASKLQSGIVWLNCWMVRDLRTPFGGVKSSGVGREGGLDAMRFFTEPKNVCVKVHS